jgi:uncharacterized membrane protein YccC
VRPSAVLFVLTAGVSAGMAIAAVARDDRSGAYLFKPLTTLIILIGAAFLVQPGLRPYRSLVVLGLGFALAGDVLLMLPRDRFGAGLAAFLLGCAACALVATLLRNFAAYAAALAGYTAAIIAGDQLGAVGGLNGNAFLLAVYRASETCIGIVCAGIVLALTDLGGARRRLAMLFAKLSGEIANGFTGTLADAGAGAVVRRARSWPACRRARLIFLRGKTS